MKTLTITISIFLCLNTYGQVKEQSPADPPADQAGNISQRSSPQTPGLPQNNFNFIQNTRTGSQARICSFENNLSEADNALLATAQQAITVARQGEGCSNTNAPQVSSAIEEAMQNMNQASQQVINRGAGPVQITCANYEQLYNMGYQHYVRNINNENVPSVYPECSTPRRPGGSPPSEQEQSVCAAEATSRLIAHGRHTCELRMGGINADQRVENQLAAQRAVLQSMQELINDPNCVIQNREQYLNAAVALAGRATSVAVGATGQLAEGVIGIAAGLVQSMVSKLFNDSQSGGQRLQDTMNFQKLACLYEQLETKEKGCESLASQEYIGRHASDVSCLTQDDHTFLQAQELVRNVNNAVAALPTEIGNPAEVAAQINGISRSLNTPIPGGGSLLDVSLSAALDARNFLNETLALDGPQLGQRVTEIYRQQRGADPSVDDLRNFVRELESVRDQSSSMVDALNSIRGMSLRPDYADVGQSIKRIEHSGGNFFTAHHAVLGFRSRMGGDLADRIQSYNASLMLAQAHQAQAGRYQQNRSIASTNTNPRDHFGYARRGVGSALAGRMQQELNSRFNSLKQAAGNVGDAHIANPDVPASVEESLLKGHRNSFFNDNLELVIASCNQLRTVSNSQHRVCERLTCPNGLKSLAAFSQQNPAACTGNPEICQRQFICKERERLETVLENMRRDLVQTGQVCGRPAREIFR
jgi:hypothetical protein